MTEQTSDYRLLGFVLASDYRTAIILTLSCQVATPKHLSKVTSLRIGHVSNVIRTLVEKNLIECVNPEAKRGRLYRLTENGQKVFKMLSRLNLGKS